MGITAALALASSGDIIGEIKIGTDENRPLAPTASPWRNDVPQITLIEGVTQALARNEDLSVVVLGEDVGVNGGVFRATQGLQQTFGSERVIDTPLDELTIAGLTVGLAAQGMKPVAEAQFEGFIYPMMEHIACHAARAFARADA
jgi:pyruvate dehydrogenase E1 component beta subunit